MAGWRGGSQNSVQFHAEGGSGAGGYSLHGAAAAGAGEGDVRYASYGGYDGHRVHSYGYDGGSGGGGAAAGGSGHGAEEWHNQRAPECYENDQRRRHVDWGDEEPRGVPRYDLEYDHDLRSGGRRRVACEKGSIIVRVHKRSGEMMGVVCDNGIICKVKAGSPAELAGLRQFIGYLITHIDGTPFGLTGWEIYVGRAAVLELALAQQSPTAVPPLSPPCAWGSLPPPPERQAPPRHPLTRGGIIVGPGPERGLPQPGAADPTIPQRMVPAVPGRGAACSRATTAGVYGILFVAQWFSGLDIERLVQDLLGGARADELGVDGGGSGGEISPSARGGGGTLPLGPVAVAQAAPAAPAPEASPPAPTGALLGLPQIMALMGVSAHGAALVAEEAGQRAQVVTEQLHESLSHWAAAVRCGLLRRNDAHAQTGAPMVPLPDAQEACPDQYYSAGL